jgi:hypothetical protein
MSRLRKLARKHVPGERAPLARLSWLGQKLEQAKASREASTDDAKVTTSCEVPDGWTVRHGGGEATESRRWPLLPEWGGKEPPEEPRGSR